MLISCNDIGVCKSLNIYSSISTASLHWQLSYQHVIKYITAQNITSCIWWWSPWLDPHTPSTGGTCGEGEVLWHSARPSGEGNAAESWTCSWRVACSARGDGGVKLVCKNMRYMFQVWCRGVVWGRGRGGTERRLIHSATLEHSED